MKYNITESDKLHLVNFFTEVTSKALTTNQSVDFLVFNDCTKLVWQVRQMFTVYYTTTVYTIEVEISKNTNIVIFGKKAMPKGMVDFLNKWSDEVGIPIRMPSYI
jgi:hypothetical protein